MAVKLRLRREGTKKAPFYRVVAADARSPRDGRFIEIIGVYHPMENPSKIEVDPDRALHWLQHGAQPRRQGAGDRTQRRAVGGRRLPQFSIPLVLQRQFQEAPERSRLNPRHQTRKPPVVAHLHAHPLHAHAAMVAWWHASHRSSYMFDERAQRSDER